MQKKVPWLQHHLQSQVCKSALALYINFQGEHLYRAGEMENMHPLRPLILKFTACLSTSSFFQNNSGYRGDESRGRCIDSDVLVHFPPLTGIFPYCMRNLHTKPVTGAGISSMLCIAAGHKYLFGFAR